MVYLLHFDRSFRHARHFIGVGDARVFVVGKTLQPDEIPDAPILQEAAARGVLFTVARVWDGDALRARQLRSRNNALVMCPYCSDVRVALAPGAPSGVVAAGTDDATTGGGQRASLTGKRQKVAYRSLGKHGGSLMLCVPGVFVHALRVFRGAHFELVLDDDEGGFHARVVNRGRIGRPAPANVHGVAEVSR